LKISCLHARVQNVKTSQPGLDFDMPFLDGLDFSWVLLLLLLLCRNAAAANSQS
jgi:hypothetical protein